MTPFHNTFDMLPDPEEQLKPAPLSEAFKPLGWKDDAFGSMAIAGRLLPMGTQSVQLGQAFTATVGRVMVAAKPADDKIKKHPAPVLFPSKAQAQTGALYFARIILRESLAQVERAIAEFEKTGDQNKQ